MNEIIHGQVNGDGDDARNEAASPPLEQSLEQRIATSLANTNAGSTDLAELIVSVEQAIVSAEQPLADTRTRLLDLIGVPDPSEAREQLIVTELARDRLRAILPRLRDKLQACLASEHAARWAEDYRRVKAKVEEAAREFAEIYSDAVADLIAIFAVAAALDK